MKDRLGVAGVIVLLVLASTFAPGARAAANEVNFDFFYSALPDSGTWRESVDLGFVWQPKVAVTKADWRPYTDGYWSLTDQGWTWVSLEEFGWATYHYGRWAKIPDPGWVWIPGFEWAPAWVTWRASANFTGQSAPPPSRNAPQIIAVESEDVIGWAPLPPGANFIYTRGFSAQVDVDYDIGPAAYNFVPVRYFGELALQPWIFRPPENAAFMASTWNCTNVAYLRPPGCIFVGGPSYAALRPVLPQPVPRLNLVAQNVNSTPPAGGYANRVQGNAFLVVAPRISPPAGVAVGLVGLLPRRVSSTPPVIGLPIDAQPPDRGWPAEAGSGSNATLRAQLKQQAIAAPKVAVAAPVNLAPTHVITVSGPPAAARRPPASARSSIRRAQRVSPPRIKVPGKSGSKSPPSDGLPAEGR